MLKFTLTIVLLFTSTCVGFTQSARQYTRNQTEAKAIVERVLKAAPVIDGITTCLYTISGARHVRVVLRNTGWIQ